MTIYWHNTGPLVRFENGLLTVENLNPQTKTRWRMSRIEMIRFGIKAVIAALCNPSK